MSLPGRVAVVSALIALALALALMVSTGTTPGRGDAASAARPAAAPAVRPAPGAGFQRGMVLETHSGEHDHPEAPRTLRELAALGVNAVQVVPFAYQPDIEEPELRFRDFTTRQIGFIEEAHELGMAVFVKPHIWSRQFWGPEARWHGDLHMHSDADWQLWFANYRRYILHYAGMAEEHGCEGFCIGLEYVRATRERPEDWRALIAAVRAVYHGPITYAANLHDEAQEITFWDELDWIGINAYPSLGGDPGLDVETLVRGFEPTIALLAHLAERYRRPVLITEIGFPAVRGAAIRPWEWPGRDDPVDLEEQSRAYEATFRALWPQPWLAGLYFWKWPLDGRGGGPGDPEYTPRGKPAARVLASYYLRPDAEGADR